MFIRMLSRGNLTTLNYRKKVVPCGMGLLFFFIILIWMPLLICLYPEEKDLSLAFILCTASLAFIGLLDDFIGDRTIKGLKGHFSSLIQGTLTSGILKALTGIYLSFIVVMVTSSDMVEGIIDFILLSLSINFINLLDVRPGRAVKTFIIFSVIFLFFPKPTPVFFLLIGTVLCAMIYLPLELKEMYMLGDTGANVLGGLLGINVILGTPSIGKIIFALWLVGIHYIAERTSISLLVDKIPLLHYFDSIGRKKA
ncbi:MAG: hypothetical protein ACOX6S_04280 [Clostridia bacterium]